MDNNMDIECHSESATLKPPDRILRKLALLGVPEELLDQLEPGLVIFAKDKKSEMPKLVSAVLPTNEEVAEVLQDAKAGSKRAMVGPTMKNQFREGLLWLQWLMFEEEPTAALRKLSQMSIGQRGVCGAVWGRNDIAYRCRTCEHDPTCAICVPCFRNGDHRDHDYSIIYTGGGCCDCGDITAWKREGFCSKHKGAEQIQILREELANSVGPVLEALFDCWKRKLLCAEKICLEHPKRSDRVLEHKKVANELSFAVVEMLLEFCKHSESLLSFISKMVISSAGFLDVLVRSERILSDFVVRKVHELLLKLLGEPIFKYEFAKAFLGYYPIVAKEAIKECNDHSLKKYPLLPTFSVQIFTVPTLTPCLVKEMNLLAMLLGCLGDILVSCAGEDGRLQVTKWQNLYELTFRIVDDIRFVMGHAVVPQCVFYDQQDISRTWLRILAFVQGMNPQKRETGIHIEEENDSMHLPFGLCHSIANIHSLLVDGAFSVSSNEKTDSKVSFDACKETPDEIDCFRHAKVGRLSQECSACNVADHTSSFACTSETDEVGVNTHLPSFMWLIYECLRAIDNWLSVDSSSGTHMELLYSNSSNFSALKKTISRISKGKYIIGRISSSIECHASHTYGAFRMSDDDKTIPGSEGKSKLNSEINSTGCDSKGIDDRTMKGDSPMDVDALNVLSLSDWPNISYDVTSQDISLHIPIHRFLSLLLQRTLKTCFDPSSVPNKTFPGDSNFLSAIYTDFFQNIFVGCHPYGFSSLIMEHPLRIRVFCSQVRAGMWRRNGDAALLSCELYRSVRWSEQSMELDLFLLQCCGAFAPADAYVHRILERYGLADYLSLNVERSNEFEPVLVQEMLTLIIQIVKERRFCGLTDAENLRRELICKLAMGDTTHSQLVKSLPRDLSKCSELQEILDAIAVYAIPTGYNQGMYSLRWECWKELDLYHPRWSSRELQVAEERYLRFCNVSALTSQLPKWTKIYHPYMGVHRVAICKAVLQIIRAVLFYAVFSYKSTESRAPDGVLLSAVHLLALALDICFQVKGGAIDGSCYSEDSIPLLAFAGEEVVEGLTFANGGQCLLSLLVLLMRMHREENSENLLEAGSFNISTVVESLLKKFAKIDSRCHAKVQQLAPDIVSHSSQSDSSWDTHPNGCMKSFSSTSDSENRKAKARERQAAIMEKMRAQQSKFLASIHSTVEDDTKSGQELSGPDDIDSIEEVTQVTCSLCHDSTSTNPVSFLILLQKSKLLSFMDRGSPSWERPSLLDENTFSIRNTVPDQFGVSTSSGGSAVISPSQLSQLVQNAVKNYSYRSEPEEVGVFLEYLKARISTVRDFEIPSTSTTTRETELHAFETIEEDIYFSSRREMHDFLLSVSDKDEKLTTADARFNKREEDKSGLLVKCMATLLRDMKENPSVSEDTCNETVSGETTQSPAYDGFGSADCDGIYLSSCGHAVHQSCLDRYLSSLKDRFVRRIVFEGGHIVDPEQGEFLCPVCRRLANSVLPELPGKFQNAGKQGVSSIVCSSNASCHFNDLNEDIDSLYVHHALALLQSAAKVTRKGETLKAFPLYKHGKMSHNLESVTHVLSKMFFPKSKSLVLGAGRMNPSMLMWDTLKYSLISMEIASRSRNYLTPSIGLNILLKELKSSSGFVMSLLLQAVQSMRNMHTLHVLQRFIGIQNFADSICFGVSNDYGGETRAPGNILCILKHADMETSSPNNQFWNRASDPTLARDPFSSLMWVLFCLPYPFLSCKDSLLSLVHLFYIVSVAQATIAYWTKYPCKISELGFSDCLIADICKAMDEFGCTQQYFVANNIDPSLDIKDVIRSLTFPFLRRCALLWKLLNSSVQAPLFHGENVLDRSPNVDDMMDTVAVELNEVEKLEKMFKIPPLDIVQKDGLCRSIVLKWCSHLCTEFEVHRIKRRIHFTPAIPFQLMSLPRKYHDLLQKHIKQRCTDCKSVIDDPALCLLCGRLCSPSWKSCCRESGCQAHAMVCGAGTGVFLLIKRTTILLQRSARQAPWLSPYLDAFGEEDVEMHRGKPLYLNNKRYAALSYMVACHGLDQCSKVLGQTTIGSFFTI